MATTYAITWTHTSQVDSGYDTYEAAIEAVRGVLKHAEIGHDGDISRGGDRTLFWSSAEAAADDGARAAGSIYVRHPSEVR